MSVHERIPLGLDPVTKTSVGQPYTLTEKTDLSNYIGIFQADIDVMTGASQPSQIELRRQEAVHNYEEIRESILASSYVEEGEIIESLSHGKTAVREAGGLMICGWLQGARALSFRDHDTRIYPLYQFEDLKTFKPHDVIAAVNLVKGKLPGEETTLSDVYWWHLSAQNREIWANTKHAEEAPKDMLTSYSLHQAILKRAVYQRLG